MKTTQKKITELKAEAKLALGLRLDAGLWGKVRLFAVAASFHLKQKVSVSPYLNNTWGVAWQSADGTEYFKAFKASDFSMSAAEFLAENFGNEMVLEFQVQAA